MYESLPSVVSGMGGQVIDARCLYMRQRLKDIFAFVEMDFHAPVSQVLARVFGARA